MVSSGTTVSSGTWVSSTVSSGAPGTASSDSTSASSMFSSTTCSISSGFPLALPPFSEINSFRIWFTDFSLTSPPYNSTSNFSSNDLTILVVNLSQSQSSFSLPRTSGSQTSDGLKPANDRDKACFGNSKKSESSFFKSATAEMPGLPQSTKNTTAISLAMSWVISARHQLFANRTQHAAPTWAASKDAADGEE